jgi:hypothetical protein
VTIQVGMLASDGIVLVEDVWTYANVDSPVPPTSIWSAEAVSKISTVDGSNVAVARACDTSQSCVPSD